VQWLDRNGITIAEARRNIQPAYDGEEPPSGSDHAFVRALQVPQSGRSSGNY
jgi:hypothetical protein